MVSCDRRMLLRFWINTVVLGRVFRNLLMNVRSTTGWIQSNWQITVCITVSCSASIRLFLYPILTSVSFPYFYSPRPPLPSENTENTELQTKSMENSMVWECISVHIELYKPRTDMKCPLLYVCVLFIYMLAVEKKLKIKNGKMSLSTPRMRAKRMEIQLPSFFTSSLDGSHWSISYLRPLNALEISPGSH